MFFIAFITAIVRSKKIQEVTECTAFNVKKYAKRSTRWYSIV